MRKKWKTWAARGLSAVLIAAMTAVYLPAAEAAEAEAATVSGSSGGTSYEGELNAMTAEEYAKFGLATNSPEEFNPADTSNPLEGYEATVIPSELYVSYGNKTNEWESEFFVADESKKATAEGFDLDTMDDDLIGDRTSLGGGRERTYVSSECALDFDGDGTDELVVMEIGREDNVYGDTQPYGCMYLSLYDYHEDSPSWEILTTGSWYLTMYGQDWTQDLSASGSKGLLALTSGDFDGDGNDEVAFYLPREEGKTCIRVVDFSTDGTIRETPVTYLTELSVDGGNYGYETDTCKQPIVSLATTSISGQDDLVVSVSMPVDSNYTTKYGEKSVLAIYRLNSKGSYESIYHRAMYYEDEQGGGISNYTYMSFCSAVDADVNGNGIQELVIGGYRKVQSGVTWAGEEDDDNNLIQIICWNEANQAYEEVWDSPVVVEGHPDVPSWSANHSSSSVRSGLVEPVAIAAGKLHAGSTEEQIFLEGNIFCFNNAGTTATTEKERLASGSFELEYSIPLGGYNNPFISSAYAACFTTARGGYDQLVILAGDYYSASISDNVYYDITWVWEDENGNLTGAVTNDNYIENKSTYGEGTFISLCPLNADQDQVTVEYGGKTYGWSDPTLYCVLQSPPYWSELQYNSETYGTGEVSYSISYGTSSGREGDFGIGLGCFIGGEAMAGVGFLGNGGMVGGGIDLSLMGSYVGTWESEHSVQDSVEFISAPGEDKAIILAVPLVIYHYKVLIPEYEVTQSHIDAYEEMREANPDLEPYPYEIGDIVPASWEDYEIQQTLEPAFGSITVEEYNELAEEYGDEKGLEPITEETFAEKTIGDPSTYPDSQEALEAPGNVDNLHVSTEAIRTTVGESGAKLSYEIEKESGHSDGFEISFDGSLYAKAKTEASIFISEESEIEGGFTLAIDGGCSWISTTTNGMEFSTTINNLPAGCDDYAFTTRLAVFNNTDLPMGGGETDSVNDQGYAYCVGYIVTDVDAPPQMATDLRVFATTEHAVVLKWDTSTYRPAQSWEVFIEDPVTGQEYSRGITNETYYVATNLEPGTTYKFALKSYEQKDGGGAYSVMSRWVSATTKDSSSSAPYFTQQPQHVIVTPDDGEVHTMTAEAQLGEGMEGATLTYQWQEYTLATLTGEGQWVNIDGATGTTYTLPEITSENVSEFKEQTHYRVVATQAKGDNIKSTISKVATMYINSDGSEHNFNNLNLDLTVSGEQLEELDGVYYTDGGTADFTVTISPAQEGGLTPITGDILLMYREDGEEKGVLGRGSFANRETTCTISGVALPTGVYEIYAVYPNVGPDGSEDNQSFYLPAQSDMVTLHSIEEYQITYYLNGGVNNSANPTMLTNESPAVTLENPARNYYSFNGWYTDEALTNLLTDNVLDPETMPVDSEGNVNLYAGWTAVSYAIQYELNGGTNNEANPATYTVEDTIWLEDPAREGYTFLGWYASADFTGDPVEKINGTTAASNAEATGDPQNNPLTLYAKWEEIPEDPPFDQDDETGAYLISSYNDLVLMAQKIQEKPGQYASATYVQTCNINCEEQAWELPFGTEAVPFQGTYEGEDFYILGLRPTGTANGLFGVIGENGKVKNLSVVDFDYSAPVEMAGGLAGVNRGTIIGCGSGINLTSAAIIFRNGEAVPLYTLNSEISGTVVGGLVGRNEGTIQDSRSNAVVSGTVVGGIAGENTGMIRNVYNVGTVAGTDAADSAAGGLVGRNVGAGSVRYGYNGKTVTGTNAGGIAGTSENTNLQDLWYPSDLVAACSNQPDDALTAGKKSTDEMKSQEFCDTLNAAVQAQKEELNLETWTYSASENEGYPRISRTVVVQQTLTNEEYGITVSGQIHPGAQLKLVKLSAEDTEYQGIAEAIKSGKLLEGWRLLLQYEDGTYATWEGKLTITLTPETKEKLKNLSIFHMNDKGSVSELATLNDGEQLIVQTETLGGFAVVESETGSEYIDPDDPDNPANPDNNGSSGADGSKDNGKIQSGKKGTDVKTGDTASPVVMLVILLLAGGVIVGLIIWRRKRK